MLYHWYKLAEALETNWRYIFLLFQVLTFEVECNKVLGDLLVIILQKECHHLFPNSPWFVDKVEVKSPMGDCYQFPIYKWITDCNDHYYQEGSGWSSLST